MKQFILPLLLLAAAVTACNEAGSSSPPETFPEKYGTDNLAYQWGAIALELTAYDTDRFSPRPTVTSRYLGLIFTAIFDAWSRYDDKAVPVFLDGVDRRPEAERHLKNKETAISYAAYRAMSEYFYTDTSLLRAHMVRMGFDPSNESEDPTTPEGIGNLAARKVIESRRSDGSNMYGDHPGGNGKPYYDYTEYKAFNSPDTLRDIRRWQPKYFGDGKGGKWVPPCLTPYWYNVKPLTLDSASQHRPGPPPAIGSEELAGEIAEVVELNANLTNEQKALVEFMRDGPSSVQQAGHWLIFAQDVSRRDNHTLDQDVKMYFAVEITAMDAFIACWDSKMHYDYARPYALVHNHYGDKPIKAWGGPGKGTVEMKGKEWCPYSPETFLCPQFPAYVSGHSTISGGCAEILKWYTGSDSFGQRVKLKPGALTEPEINADTVELVFPTFTETAEMAGISRVMGGYHIQADNVAGLELGRNVAKTAWEFYERHVNGEVQ